jgi:hypothetical protein
MPVLVFIQVHFPATSWHCSEQEAHLRAEQREKFSILIQSENKTSFYTLKMEAEYSSKTSVNIRQSFHNRVFFIVPCYTRSISMTIHIHHQQQHHGFNCLGYKDNKKFWKELIAYFPWCDTSHIQNDASNNSSIIACVFITSVTFLPSRCLVTIGGFLPSRYLATIRGYLPSRRLTTIGEILLSRCLATIGRIHRHAHARKRTYTTTWSHMPPFIFSK